MAICHFAKSDISRGAGRSSVASAAYQAANTLYSDRTQQFFSYERKAGVLHTEIFTPTGIAAPTWMQDRQELWNRLEAAHPRKNARLATQFTIALPAELSEAERHALAREYTQLLADKLGVAADLAIHAPSREGDQRNHHVHIMLTSLKVTEQGFGERYDFAINSTNRKALGMVPVHQQIKDLRTEWAHMANLHLAAAGFETRIDARSFKERGLDVAPTQHVGPNATEMQRRGILIGNQALSPEAEAHNVDVIRNDPSQVLKILTDHEAVFTRQDIARAVHRYVGSHEGFAAALAAVMTSPELVQLQGDIRRHADGREIEIQDGRQVDRQGAEVRDPALQVSSSDPLVDVARFSTSDMVALEAGMAAQAVQLAARTQASAGVAAGQSEDPLAAARQSALEALAEARRGADGRAFALTAEQAAALKHVTQSDRLALVVGVAGAGKSTMLEAARRTWEGAGYQVIGAALAATAAGNLAESSGIGSRTVDSLLLGWQRRDAWNAVSPGERANLESLLSTMSAEQRAAYGGPTPPPRNLVQLGPQSVLVVDEAGMIESAKMARLVDEVHKTGAKLVLVGDPDQLPAIGAGAAFRAMAERVGFAEIATVYRQREEWQRQATMDLSRGRVGAALGAYAAHGAIELTADLQSAREAVVADYMAQRAAEPGAAAPLVLAHRNADVAALNSGIREARLAKGEIEPGVLFSGRNGNRLYAAGDRVQLLANGRLEIQGGQLDGRGRPILHDVRNSDLGTVLEAAPGRLVVQLDGTAPGGGPRPAVVISQAAYQAIDHGYAVTVHKAQGATADRVMLLASPTLDRSLAYVGLSRHRDSVAVYAGRDEFKDIAGLKEGLGRWSFKQSTLDYAQGFFSKGQNAHRTWVANETTARQEADRAQRAVLLDNAGWEKAKVAYRSMSSAALAAAAKALTPAPVRPSDVDAHPDVKRAVAGVVQLETRLADVARDYAAAIAAQRAGDPAAAATVARLQPLKTSLEMDLMRAERREEQTRSATQRQLEQKAAVQRGRYDYTIKALDSAIARELRAGSTGSRAEILRSYRGMSAADLAQALKERQPSLPTPDSVAADPAVRAASAIVEQAHKRHVADPTPQTQAALDRARADRTTAFDKAHAAQYLKAVSDRASWHQAVQILDRTIAREQRDDIRHAARDAMLHQSLRQPMALTAEQRSNARQLVDSFKQAHADWRASYSAPAAQDKASAELREQRQALRDALGRQADRVLADPAARQVAREQRLYDRAETHSSLYKQAESAEVASRRNVALAVPADRDALQAPAADGFNYVAGIRGVIPAQQADDRTAQQDSAAKIQSFRESLGRYYEAYSASRQSASAEASSSSQAEHRSELKGMRDELRQHADAVLAQPQAAAHALNSDMAASIVRYSSQGAEINRAEVAERRQALLAEAPSAGKEPRQPVPAPVADRQPTDAADTRQRDEKTSAAMPTLSQADRAERPAPAAEATSVQSAPAVAETRAGEAVKSSAEARPAQGRAPQEQSTREPAGANRLQPAPLSSSERQAKPSRSSSRQAEHPAQEARRSSAQRQQRVQDISELFGNRDPRHGDTRPEYLQKAERKFDDDMRQQNASRSSDQQPTQPRRDIDNSRER
ncbi:Ti-type conjugative transfer relaxase TraA [Enhydrobacter aerosaccus]|uniref:Ti-type conjugative transfer relaxase TraA n=1 Tax=Enhydrobacter aerosaccus TaxID=225324 RepID=A0A1T4TJ47_9HYPH|nr:MobQ family relaxase [Enhydrobacter aerosaccus]SKA40500.1 Ti-type conjugative transfer relaxase TraA [Enhydrobacter aerosaccus]